MIKVHTASSTANGKKTKWFWFTFCGKNGHVFATSETYTRERDCMKAARKMYDIIDRGRVEWFVFGKKTFV